MSIFSKFKAAKKGSDAQGAAPPKKSNKAPYKHIPTHAARDALTCSPAHWQTRSSSSDRRKRHSEMPISRTESSLSAIASGDNAYLPRAASYAGASNFPGSTYSRTQSWDARTDAGSVVSSSYEPVYAKHRIARGYSYHGPVSHDFAIGPSPLASHMASTEVSVSSGNSSESDSDNLRIPTQPKVASRRAKGKGKMVNVTYVDEDKLPGVTVVTVA